MEADYQSFKETLDKTYAWPVVYTFKFIVPHGKEGELRALFPRHMPTQRPSQKGNYVAITIQMMMPSSDAVIEIYQRVSGIEGIISL